jgi:acetyl-CoA acyltransferase
MVTVDDGVREGTTVETLAKLKPAFKIGGPVTAGNSSQMTDGAAVTLVVSEEYLERIGKRPDGPLYRLSANGCAPEVMGIGPIAAIPAALKLAG